MARASVLLPEPDGPTTSSNCSRFDLELEVSERRPRAPGVGECRARRPDRPGRRGLRGAAQPANPSSTPARRSDRSSSTEPPATITSAEIAITTAASDHAGRRRHPGSRAPSHGSRPPPPHATAASAEDRERPAPVQRHGEDQLRRGALDEAREQHVRAPRAAQERRDAGGDHLREHRGAGLADDQRREHGRDEPDAVQQERVERRDRAGGRDHAPDQVPGRRTRRRRRRR